MQAIRPASVAGVTSLNACARINSVINSEKSIRISRAHSPSAVSLKAASRYPRSWRISARSWNLCQNPVRSDCTVRVWCSHSCFTVLPALNSLPQVGRHGQVGHGKRSPRLFTSSPSPSSGAGGTVSKGRCFGKSSSCWVNHANDVRDRRLCHDAALPEDGHHLMALAPAPVASENDPAEPWKGHDPPG